MEPSLMYGGDTQTGGVASFMNSPAFRAMLEEQAKRAQAAQAGPVPDFSGGMGPPPTEQQFADKMMAKKNMDAPRPGVGYQSPTQVPLTDFAAPRPAVAPTQQLGLAPAAPMAAPAGDPGAAAAFKAAGVNYSGMSGGVPAMQLFDPNFASKPNPNDPAAMYRDAFQKAIQQGGFIDTRDMSPAAAAQVQLQQQQNAQRAALGQLGASTDMQRYAAEQRQREEQNSPLKRIGEAAAAKVFQDGGSAEEARRAYYEIAGQPAAGGTPGGAGAAGAAGAAPQQVDQLSLLRKAAQEVFQQPGAAPGMAPKFNIGPAQMEQFMSRIPQDGASIDAFANEVRGGKFGDPNAFIDTLAKRAALLGMNIAESSKLPREESAGKPWVVPDLPNIQLNPNLATWAETRRMMNPLNLTSAPFLPFNEIQLANGRKIQIDTGDLGGMVGRAGVNRDQMLPRAQAASYLLQQLLASQGK